MINEAKVKSYCCDDISKIYGYREAVEDKEKMWHCHHCLGLVYTKEELIKRGLYYNQPAEMLLFCTKSEHQALHKIDTKPHRELCEKRSMIMKGHITTQETRNKISRANRGKVRSEEVRRKMSIARIGKHYESEEQILKKSKPVMQFTKDGVFVKQYKSMSDAQRYTGTRKGNISKCCSGKVKTANGYVWRFVD